MKHFSVLRMFKKITDLRTHVLVNIYFYYLFRVFYIPKQPTKKKNLAANIVSHLHLYCNSGSGDVLQRQVRLCAEESLRNNLASGCQIWKFAQRGSMALGMFDERNPQAREGQSAFLVKPCKIQIIFQNFNKAYLFLLHFIYYQMIQTSLFKTKTFFLDTNRSELVGQYQYLGGICCLHIFLP